MGKPKRRPPLDKSKHVVASDWHSPWHDEYAVAQLFTFIKETRPATIHLLGDLCDCYAISKFSHDPDRKERLQWEFDTTATLLKELRSVAGRGAKIIYSSGNHEHRMIRYLRTTAPELAGLRCLDMKSLLGLDKQKIVWRGADEPYRIGDLMLTHGSLVRKWSGTTARAHYEKWGRCVLHGHTHRLGSFYHRTSMGTFGSWENGCLCELEVEFDPSPNWQQGWSVVWTHGKRFHVEQVPLISGKFVYHGQLYGEREIVNTTQEIPDAMTLGA